MKRPLSILLALSTVVSLNAADNNWPQWRGPNRNDNSPETGLLKSWPDGGPKRVWLYDKAGLGYSGPAIVNGKLFTMGVRDQTEFLICLEEKTGKELWATEIGDRLQNGWGDGPRGTPNVNGDHVYTMGGQGTLICAQVADGKKIWSHTMSEFGGKRPNWGYTESVLVDGKQVVCTPGGNQGAMIALDKMTGATLWQAKEFTDGAQYSSIVPAKINGQNTYVQLTMQHVVGISPTDGKLLWQSDWPGKTAVIPTSIVKDNYVYVSSGYGVGCKLVKVEAGNKPTDVYVNKVMKNHHGGVVLVGDYLYGYSDGPGWVCQNFMTGEEVWSNKDLKKGAVSYADGMLYCLEEGSGTVTLVEANPKAFVAHGKFTLDPQTQQRSPQGKIWTHPVVINGMLFLRDQEYIYCYDVRGDQKL